MKQKLLTILLAACCASASATTLNALMNVDNAFDFYVATDDASNGTFVSHGDNWPTTYASNGIALTSGVKNYLHVVAYNWGGPGGFLGSFNLSDADFAFANGTQQLLTGTTGWQQNLTGFGTGYSAVADEGANGTGPWGFQGAYGSDPAHWIWNYDSRSGSDTNTVFFTAEINPVAAAVPEPLSIALLGLGLAAMGATYRRKK